MGLDPEGAPATTAAPTTLEIPDDYIDWIEADLRVPIWWRPGCDINEPEEA